MCPFKAAAIGFCITAHMPVKRIRKVLAEVLSVTVSEYEAAQVSHHGHPTHVTLVMHDARGNRAMTAPAAPADVKDDLLLQIRRLLDKSKPELQKEWKKVDCSDFETSSQA